MTLRKALVVNFRLNARAFTPCIAQDDEDLRDSEEDEYADQEEEEQKGLEKLSKDVNATGEEEVSTPESFIPFCSIGPCLLCFVSSSPVLSSLILSSRLYISYMYKYI